MWEPSDPPRPLTPRKGPGSREKEAESLSEQGGEEPCGFGLNINITLFVSTGDENDIKGSVSTKVY